MFPLPQPAIIVHFQLFGNDERNKAFCKALLEHDEPPDAAVAVLKRVYALKSLMEMKFGEGKSYIRL